MVKPTDTAAAETIDFRDLEAQAGTIDATAPGLPGTVAIAPAVAMADEIFGLLKMPRALVQSRFAWWPEFGTVWSDDQLRVIAQALADLCAHMGWTLDQLMGQFGPWLALAIAAGMPAFATYLAIKDRRAVLQAQADAERKEAAE